jgi:ATP-dependent Clp protease, protease subunit
MGHGVQQPQFPDHRFVSFYGPINPPSSNNMRVGLTQMVNEGARKITLLFASPGGSTEDGISLYTYIKALPAEIIMHAVGNVGSIALPVFLAARTRLASQNARFVFHNYVWGSPQAENITQAVLAERTMLLDSALAWTRELVKATTKLTDVDFEGMKLFEKPIMINPRRALECGLISEIKEPAIPVGSHPRVII